MPKLIVVEGLDGSGKSTQLKLLAEHLEKEGHKLRCIKLPDYDHPSSTFVKMYLDGGLGMEPSNVNAFAASAFYAADRFVNFQLYWKKEYEQGTMILADRYTTSNAVHQMVKLPEEQWEEYLGWLEDFEYKRMKLPKPDLVLYLDMPVEISQKLISARYHGDERKKDVHENNLAYLQQCRTSATYASKKLGWTVISCAEDGNPIPIERIYGLIASKVQKELA